MNRLILRREPSPRPKIKARPQRSQTVTMAVGFLCRDGIVIAADTQVTGANYTFPECKLINFEWGNGSGILGYSGDRDAFIAFASELGTRLRDDVRLTDQDVNNLLKECIQASVDKKEVLLTIAGYWLDGHRFPSLVVSNTAHKVVDVVDCEVIGYADSPLARSLLGRFRALPRVSVHQARIYAVHFISQAKKYDGQYVGGNINIYSIEDHDCSPFRPSVSGGTAITREGKYTHMITADTGEWEKRIEMVNESLDLFFHQLIDTGHEPSFTHLSGTAKSFRSWAAVKGE